jgi:phage shock protein A
LTPQNDCKVDSPNRSIVQQPAFVRPGVVRLLFRAAGRFSTSKSTRSKGADAVIVPAKGADHEHMLVKKQRENEEKAADWMRKAELAVDKQQDDLARAALERHQSYTQMAESFREQVADQKVQVENLKSALNRLDQKLAEAQSKADLLIAQHRRSRTSSKASDARAALNDRSKGAAFDRMKGRIFRDQAVSEAKAEMFSDNLDDRFKELEKGDEIERMLAEVKSRRQLNG